jgi:hypothetical protein
MDEMPAWNQKISDFPARDLAEHEAFESKLEFGFFQTRGADPRLITRLGQLNPIPIISVCISNVFLIFRQT